MQAAWPKAVSSLRHLWHFYKLTVFVGVFCDQLGFVSLYSIIQTLLEHWFIPGESAPSLLLQHPASQSYSCTHACGSCPVSLDPFLVLLPVMFNNWVVTQQTYNLLVYACDGTRGGIEWFLSFISKLSGSSKWVVSASRLRQRVYTVLTC